MYSKDNKLTAIDFFCGGGGMTYGLGQAGIDVLAGIDCNEGCRATYEINNPGSRFIHADITEYGFASLVETAGISKDNDNLVFVGCSPCQYWSLLKTNKTRSKKTAYLLEYFQEFIDYFRPGYVVVENVPGIVRKQNSPLESFFNFLNSSGYHYKSDGVVNAHDYGVPQNRQRYLLVASRFAPISLPSPTNHNKSTLRDVIGPQNGFAKIPAGHVDHSLRFHSTAKLSPLNIKRIRATPQNGGTRLAWKDDPALQLAAYLGKDDSFADVYGRMYWDKPSPTITTRFLSFSNGRFGHPEEDRALSIREGACLQSFPKSYKIKTNGLQAAASIIGNAVPPKMSRAIGKTIIASYNGHNS